MRIVAWPVVNRDRIVHAFKPGSDSGAEAPFRTLRRHRWASSGVRVSRRADRGLAGQMLMYSRLNVESARLARGGRGPAAELVAQAAADLESGPEFSRLQRVLEKLPAPEAEGVIDGELADDVPSQVADALRTVAIRTEQVWSAQERIGDRDWKSPAEVAFAGQVAALYPGHAVLSQAGGHTTAVPRWMIDVAHRDRVGTFLMLVIYKLDHASAILEAVPGMDVEGVPGAIDQPRQASLVNTTMNVTHTMNVMGSTLVRVSRNGQVSVPAAVRHRWGTSTVLVVDRGDYAIVRPVPDDPIAALCGAYAAPGPTADEARAADRAGEAASEDRRRGTGG